MCTMAAGDLTTTALLMTVLGVLIAISVLFSRTVDKLGVPVVLLFLVLGIIGGSEGVGGIAFDNYSLTMRLGTLALVLGNGAMPHRSGLTRIHDALAWMGQITMFLMLGLLVFPSHLVQVATAGLGIGLVLAVIARPAAVALCLAPFGFPIRQTMCIGWVGLRGAVPIILATFPLLAGVEGAERIFNLVFFIVLVSSFVPGATIRPFTRRMGLLVPQRPVPEAVLEINASHTLNGELESFHISPALIVCNAPLSEIDMPHDASISLIVRGKDIVPARGKTRLQSGDHVYVFFQPKDRPFIELLFGGPEA